MYVSVTVIAIGASLILEFIHVLLITFGSAVPPDIQVHRMVK